MNKSTSLITAILIAIAVTPLGCTKDIPHDGFFNPLIGGCQVAEFHISQFDNFFSSPPPYLFRKSFDATGKVVTGIDCTFADDLLPEYMESQTLHASVIQKGHIVFLIKKPTGDDGNITDTLARIYLNKAGRPDSCVGARGSDPLELVPETEHYYYKNNRLYAVNDIEYFFPGNTFAGTDTITYDRYGNPLSFLHNSYQYDYSRRVKQQFYCDDFMETDRLFYLLQYLGFFPEITSPVNLRTRVVNVDVAAGEAVTNPAFDPEGKLISYGTLFGTSTITWQCP